MIYSFVIIIVNPPVVQAQPIVQDKQPPPPDDPMQWHCPSCGWWNTYDNMKALKIGSFQHLKRCKGSNKPLFGG